MVLQFNTQLYKEVKRQNDSNQLDPNNSGFFRCMIFNAPKPQHAQCAMNRYFRVWSRTLEIIRLFGTDQCIGWIFEITCGKPRKMMKGEMLFFGVGGGKIGPVCLECYSIHGDLSSPPIRNLLLCKCSEFPWSRVLRIARRRLSPRWVASANRPFKWTTSCRLTPKTKSEGRIN